jgi:hypothetical protein
MKKRNISKDTIEAAIGYCGSKEALALRLDRSVRSIELYLANGCAPLSVAVQINTLARRLNKGCRKE